MALDFPTSPSDGDNFVSDNVTYIYSETKDIWYTKSNVNTVTLTTTNVGEGDNLYFTNTRVFANISPLLNTTTITEGDNLYFTNTRAIGALTAGESLEIASNGLVTVAVSEVDLGSVSQNIIPSTNEVFSLGSSNNRWKDLFLSGNTIVLGDVAIKAANGTIATATVESNGYVVPQETAVAGNPYDQETESTGYFALPTGTTEERPEAPPTGAARYNSSNDAFEFYANTGWINLNSLLITSVNPTEFSGEANTSFTIFGSGFFSGIQVKFRDSSNTDLLANSVYINPGELLAFTPKNYLVSEGPLYVKVVSPSSGFQTSLNQPITTGNLPVWQTANILTDLNVAQVSVAPSYEESVLATDADSQQVSYELTSGTLPEGIVFTPANATISGTSTNNTFYTSITYSNVVITASDTIGNEVPRTFSITRKWLDGSSAALAAKSPQSLSDFGISTNGSYYYLDGSMAEPVLLETRFNYIDSKPWVLVFKAPYTASATINHINKNIPMIGFLIQQDNPANQTYSYLAVKESFNTRNSTTPTTTGGNKSGYRLFIGYGGGHGFYNTNQEVCNWLSSSGSVGAGFTGVTCGSFPNELYWGTGTSQNNYTLINDIWETLIWWQ